MLEKHQITVCYMSVNVAIRRKIHLTLRILSAIGNDNLAAVEQKMKLTSGCNRAKFYGTQKLKLHFISLSFL